MIANIKLSVGAVDPDTWHAHLIGDDGKIIATTRKSIGRQSQVELVKKYFPLAKIVECKLVTIYTPKSNKPSKNKK